MDPTRADNIFTETQDYIILKYPERRQPFTHWKLIDNAWYVVMFTELPIL